MFFFIQTMGIFSSKNYNQKILESVPKTLIDLQLTIETLKYENICLRRDLELKDREIRKLQVLVNKMNTPNLSLESFIDTGSLPPEAVASFHDQLRIYEEALRCQSSDLAVMKQNLHEVIFFFLLPGPKV